MEKLPVPENYFDNLEILKLAVKQIVKDFGIEDNEIAISEKSKTIYVDLYAEVERIILYLINNNTSKLMNLLYRVDVPEAIIKKALLVNDAESAEVVISKAIIRREFMKVITRLYFSKNAEQKALLNV